MQLFTWQSEATTLGLFMPFHTDRMRPISKSGCLSATDEGKWKTTTCPGLCRQDQKRIERDDKALKKLQTLQNSALKYQLPTKLILIHLGEPPPLFKQDEMLESLRCSGRKIKLLLSLDHQLAPLVKATGSALVLRGLFFGLKSGNETFVEPHNAATAILCLGILFWWDYVVNSINIYN